jgi:hypothetical protein
MTNRIAWLTMRARTTSGAERRAWLVLLAEWLNKRD